MRKRIPALLLVFGVISSFLGCEVIYNYDLSLSGLDSLPATKSCIQKYIPKSVDAHKGRQHSEIEAVALELDKHKDEIIDSLLSDSVSLDTGFVLKFYIMALDPENEITEVEIIREYFNPEE